MDINVGVSNRHIHLSQEDFVSLFNDEEFYSIRDLSQGGEFASNLTLDVVTPKATLNNVRVVGPFREHTQVEISITDAYKLGISPNVCVSGNLDEAFFVKLKNGDNEIEVKGCIVAQRHVHLNTKDSIDLNLKNGDIVSVVIPGSRGGRLDNVAVRVKENYHLELHLDTDEANAFNLKNGSVVKLVREGKDE